MATKIQLIKLEPENITFVMTEKEPTVELFVHNTSEKMVAFKVKTTHPKRYLVRPNQDVIPVGGSSKVKISLQIKDAKQLRNERISGLQVLDRECIDNKFLVQCAVVRDQMVPELEELCSMGNTKELANKLKTFWTETTREGLVNKKLQCLFDYPEDVGLLMGVNNTENINVPFALVAQEEQTAKEGSSVDELLDLRKKYNELINFTVQLTAERDRFKASLKDVAKEIQLLKQGQQARVATDRTVEDKAEVDESAEIVSSGFALWQIMLVAVLAFLMGRLVM